MYASLGSRVTSTNAWDLSRSTHGLPIFMRASRLSAATGMFPGRIGLMDAPAGPFGSQSDVWRRIRRSGMRERLLELDADLSPRLRAPARVQHHPQDTIDPQ